MTSHRPPDGPSLRIIPLLEAVASAAATCDRGVAAIRSWDRIFVWDARPMASRGILEAVASQEGTVEESHSIDAEGESFIGVLVLPDSHDGMTLRDHAGSLRLRYEIATGNDILDSPPPF